jgi:ribosome-binding protein aMBF1 (putative translation factor)
MDPNIQDWDNRVIRKTVNPCHQSHVSRPTSTTKTTYDADGNEIVKLKTVSHEMAQFIIKARTSNNLKQKELATRANIDAKILADIERGGCIYDAGQINKIAKALGVTIPRK